MSLIARLVAFAADALGLAPGPGGTAEDDDLAVVALLVHVARVDGSIGHAERFQLLRFLEGRFGVVGEEAERLIARASALDDEARDLADLVERVGRGLPEDERRRLLALAYRIAAADGVVREFEDDLVWRLGRLLGFDDAAIVAVRDEAAPHRTRPGAPVA